jgi:tetratricopeptide (TPR) repeat protein
VEAELIAAMENPARDEHLSLDTLASWLAGELPHEEVLQRVVPHLLDHCPSCRQRHEDVLIWQREVEHWNEAVAVREGRQAPEQFARLRELSFEEQLQSVERDAEFQTWGLCQLLLRESREAVLDAPARAVELAEMATRIAEVLPGEAYDPHWLLDLRAKCWAYLGNARRVLGELWSADEAFRRADAYLAESMTGNVRVRAEVADLKASQRRAQRRLEDALALIDEAIRFYQEVGDAHRIGRSLINKATILEEQGEYAKAISLLRESEPLVDPQREPRLAFCLRKNLVVLLTSAGRLAEAESLLPEVRRLVDAEHNPLDLVRLAWAEGRIALGLGRLGPAEAAFRDAQREFFARGMGYDAALVSLDLAILYAQEGCTVEIKQLATEILPVFESREVHREAMAALLMFQQAAEEETLTLELARHLAGFLERERRRLS